MKKKWVAPRVEVQKFEANEYVAACWGVVCDKGVRDEWVWENGLKLHHSKDVCGSFANQVIYDDDNDGEADRMVELHYGENGATLYEDGTYSKVLDIKQVRPGQILYWITKGPLGVIDYHHQGIVQEKFPGHPNRS